MDKCLTDCITQLAERALELGEPNTAGILFSLVAHRLLSSDKTLAAVVAVQTENLRAIIDKKLKQYQSPDEPKKE